MLVYALSPKTAVRFSYKDIVWSDLGGMIVKGIPKVVRRAANMLRPMFLNRLVLTLGGGAAMSAMSIRNNLDSISDVVGFRYRCGGHAAGKRAVERGEPRRHHADLPTHDNEAVIPANR